MANYTYISNYSLQKKTKQPAILFKTSPKRQTILQKTSQYLKHRMNIIWFPLYTFGLCVQE